MDILKKLGKKWVREKGDLPVCNHTPQGSLSIPSVSLSDTHLLIWHVDIYLYLCLSLFSSLLHTWIHIVVVLHET